MCQYVRHKSENRQKSDIHVRILVSSVSFSRKGGAQVEVRLVFCPACGTDVISGQISVKCDGTHFVMRYQYINNMC